jgi:hypothetical protein
VPHIRSARLSLYLPAVYSTWYGRANKSVLCPASADFCDGPGVCLWLYLHHTQHVHVVYTSNLMHTEREVSFARSLLFRYSRYSVSDLCFATRVRMALWGLYPSCLSVPSGDWFLRPSLVLACSVLVTSTARVCADCPVCSKALRATQFSLDISDSARELEIGASELPHLHREAGTGKWATPPL